MTLYELNEKYQQLLDMVESGDVDPQTLTDTMEAVEGEIEDKLEGYACIIKQMEADVAGLKTEEDRISSRRKSLESNIKRMKECMQLVMVRTGKPKVKTKLFNLNIQKNPAAAEILDIDNVPGDFWTIPAPTVNKSAVRDYLKENGDQEWARLVQTESLRIK
jgi:hypothetical protein